MSFASPSGSKNAAQRPTEQDWEAAKDRIEELYVDQNVTLKQVVNILTAERGLQWGLHATERMFKARLAKWGFAQKNTKGIEYEAMKMIYDDYRMNAGIEIKFTGRQGSKRKDYQMSQVEKQLTRPGAKEKRKMLQKEIARLGVDEVLKRKGIQYRHSRVNSDSPGSMASSSSSLESDSDHDVGTEQEGPVVVQNAGNSGSALLYHSSYLGQPFNSMEADLDMCAVFDAISAVKTAGCYEDPWHRLESNVLPRQSEPMRDTMIWAYHVFETSIKTDEKRSDTAAGVHRNKARHTFTRMLNKSNPHILSSLIHISCVLYGLCAVDSYRSILRDCLELIDQNQSRNQTYAIPYRYALACEEGNRTAINELGTQLLLGTEQRGQASEGLSSNFLICQQFRAHHLLENVRDAEGARDILSRCLHESSRCLERNHSINVNCLNILARAYERLGQNQAAIDIYFDAAQRCEQVFGSRHPYRMVLLSSMALLQARLGMDREAESNFKEVLLSRAQLLGPGHGLTISSEQDLQDFLISRGRRAEANQLSKEREAMYHDDRYWEIQSEQETNLIRRQGRNTGLYWERPQGLFKYKFVMPNEAYMKPGTNLDLSIV